jgi:hypothetical protein
LCSACAREPDAVPRVLTLATSDPTTEATVPPATPSSEPTAAWERFPTHDTSGDLEVAKFNAYLESAEPIWANSPLRTALEYLVVDQPEALTTTVVMKTFPPEGANEAVVTFTEDGLADDSVGAVRYVLDLDRGSDGGWRIRSGSWSQRCQQGRGHQDFAPETCV